MSTIVPQVNCNSRASFLMAAEQEDVLLLQASRLARVLQNYLQAGLAITGS